VAVWGIVVGAGRGDRFRQGPHREPKQFCTLAGVRVVDYACALLLAVSDGVVVVLPSGVAWEGDSMVVAVEGGATRADSVRAGLAAVPGDADIVLVHDAARPLATRALCDAVVAAVRDGADAAVPAVPISDTVKRVEGSRVVETVDRSDLVSVQTPQAFRASVLRGAHASGGDATDDAALVESTGGTVAVVAGDPRNIKITTPDDLVVATALIESA
jgi:2-C-methyl-D-erythritol 4-phosphate cytidylyltransferase